eukprot:gb/GECH01000945.1/.p1 GENE.gb/GECH01000945.1/~~gb/GECH01000945.1/.p1  ORF type:complete len:531 (+),score=163.78 gb/GECH01000945.1/:1-1593(+)
MSSAKATPVGLASPSASSMMRTAITPPANKKPSSSRRNSKIDQEHKHKLIIEWIHEYALKHNISSISRATTDIISRDEGNMSELVEQRNLISAIREMLNIPRNTLSVDIFMRLARPLLSLFDQEPKSSLRIKKQFFMTVYMEGGGDDDELTDLYHEMFHTPDEENAVTQLFHQLKQYERNQELSSSSGESEHDDILHDEIPDIDEGAPSQRQQRNRSQDDTDTNQPPRVSLRRRVRPLSLAELRDMIYDFLDSVESRLGSTALDAIYKDVENGKYVPFQRKLAVFQGDRRSSSVHHSNDTPQGNLSPRRSSSSFSSPGMSSAPNVFTVDNLKQCVTEWHHDQGLPGSPEQLWNDIVQQKHGDIIDFKAKMGYLDQEQKPNQRNAITREIRDYRDDNNDNDNDGSMEDNQPSFPNSQTNHENNIRITKQDNNDNDNDDDTGQADFFDHREQFLAKAAQGSLKTKEIPSIASGVEGKRLSGSEMLRNPFGRRDINAVSEFGAGPSIGAQLKRRRGTDSNAGGAPQGKRKRKN